VQRKKRSTPAKRSPPVRKRVPPSSVGPRAQFPVVGVAASAGGLEAFVQLLSGLPGDTGMAFVLIQHLDPSHPSLLSEVLSKGTPMSVQQARDQEEVRPNHVYVIPPGVDLELREGRLRLMERGDGDGHRGHFPADRFLRSLAAECGSYAIGVILSGTASDGTEGLKAIKAEGGITFAQEPGTARFGGMPESAIQAGIVDHRLALPELAAELVRLSRDSYVAGRVRPAAGDSVLKQVLELLRIAVGVDFSEYKRSTVERRLSRRMALRHVARMEDYLVLLERDPLEIRALYDDIFIQVTSFFRDPEVMDGLKTFVFPEILKSKRGDAPIRIWSAGCSTGEETYSLAAVLLEFLGSATGQHRVQIFGSDVSELAIDRARQGVYPDAAFGDVGEERKRRFFTRVDQGYRISKAVRDLCVFVRHDLAHDPPFSRMDLVSCRNVLIYFNIELQKRVLSTFHYCLNHPGFLLLGRSESASSYGRLFAPVAKGLNLYARSSAPSTLNFPPRAEVRPAAQRPEAPAKPAVDLSRHLDRLLMSRYAPPGVLINEQLDVLQYRGQTGAFVAPAPGEPQNNLVKMARPGLLAPLRRTIARARRGHAPARAAGVEVDLEGGGRVCDLVVMPFAGVPESKERLFVVLFEEPVTSSSRARRKTASLSRRVERRAEHELAATREYLHSLVEEHARTSEELESANEELISGNEELQSMNEELETAKEELQSTNEELTTVNDELHNRNQELNVVNADLLNLLMAVDIPLLILDSARNIRRFTPKARDILNVLPADVGRPVDDIRPNIQVPDLDRRIARVIETGGVQESEVQDHDGHWYRLQIRPYQFGDGTVGGAILSLVDIHLLKHHVNQALQAREEAERANLTKDQFLATLSHELRSPLSVLMSYAQILQREAPANAKIKRASEAIQRATRQQVQLIEDLVHVSQIAAGKLRMEMRPVDLLGVVTAALETVSASAERKSIALETHLEEGIGPVAGDAGRLRQVVVNLLTNAIKFTPEKGKVTITLARMGPRASVVVADTGIGIDPRFLPHVFDRFAQQDPTSTRTHGGLGLGLTIVRHLVEAHGGEVIADSPGTGRGATFSVSLPLMRPRQESSPAGGVPAVGGGNGRWARPEGAVPLQGVQILVVDDDTLTRDAIAEMLEQAGAAVQVVGSVNEAMRAMAQLRPGVLISDLAMPGEDGLSLIRHLRKQGDRVPALALTALAGDEDRRRALEAGFQMHMAKPADIDRLIGAVTELARDGVKAAPEGPGPPPA